MEERPIFSQNRGNLDVFQDLMAEVLQIQKQNEKGEEALARIKEIVKQSSELVQDSENTREMVLDAKILHIGSQMIRSDVLSFDTNLTSFDPEDYANGLLLNLSDSSEPDINWNKLVPVSCSYFKRTPSISYMLGLMELEPLVMKEKKRAERKKKTSEVEKEVLTNIQTEPVPEEESDEIYQHILKCLIIAFTNNNRQPVNFFKFVIDPNSFWSSVENIFHFSFLVRDDNVKMSVDPTGIPVVEPVLNKKSCDLESERLVKNQFNFRISPSEWREFISVFKIKEAAISPFNRNK